MADQDTPSNRPQGREWQLLEKVVLEAFNEQRRARRWSVFFRLLTFAYLIGLFFLFGSFGQDGVKGDVPGGDHTAVIHVKGVIADDEDASAANLIAALRKAYDNKHTRGIILDINSPGGSPVQAGYVYDEIRRLRQAHASIPVYAVISDIGASGAYYIASAADDIYADKASLVGSIGVISSGFGFVDALSKLGVERRVFTAGENKAFLDSFSPITDKQKAFWQDVLATTHRQFIAQVRAGRGNRLKETPETFSGLVWTGEQALPIGLIDGLGSVDSVARDVIKVEKTQDYTVKRNPFERFVRQMGTAAGEGAVRALSHSLLSTNATMAQQ